MTKAKRIICAYPNCRQEATRRTMPSGGMLPNYYCDHHTPKHMMSVRIVLRQR